MSRIQEVLRLMEGKEDIKAAKLLTKLIEESGEDKDLEYFLTKEEECRGKEDDLRNLIRRYSTVERIRSEVEDDEGWELLCDEDGIQSRYQSIEEDGQIYHCVKLEAEVECPLYHFASMLYEMDLYPTWIPTVWGLGMSNCIADHYDSLAIDTRMQFALPPVIMSNREVHVDVRIFDYFDETGKIIVILENREDTEPSEGFIAAKLMRSGVVIEPHDEKSKVTMLIRVDPQLSFVPHWLIDATFRHFAKTIFTMMIEGIPATKTEEYHKRMTDASNPFYAFLRRRIAETLPSQLAHIPNSAKPA